MDQTIDTSDSANVARRACVNRFFLHKRRSSWVEIRGLTVKGYGAPKVHAQPAFDRSSTYSLRFDSRLFHLRLSAKDVIGSSILILMIAWSAAVATCVAADAEPVSDHGWTSPWLPSGGDATIEHLIAQTKTKVSGEMALESTGGIGFVRHFPEVKSGVLKIEFHIRFRYPTVEVNHPHSSVAKVYLGKGNNFAWRWHTPYAWPRAGGNSMPRFYVGKRTGDYTNFVIEPYTWYKVTTVNHLDDLTWELWVDDVKFDPQKYHGHGELTMWDASNVNALTISSRSGGIWFDAFRIWHNSKLIAACDFNARDGYVPDRTVINLPAKSDAPLGN